MKPLTSLHFSDIHLGCPRLNPDLMVDNLIRFLFPLIQKEKPQLIGIQGDLFDTSLSYADKWSPPLIKFLSGLLFLCQEQNIKLRVLRGTFSHDRIQPSIIPVLHQEMKFTFDLGYYDTIDVEYIEDYDLKVGYIPDNTPYSSSEEVIDQLLLKMKERGWDSIDYLFMHGSFSHTLPLAAQKHCKVLFREDQFSFVKGFVITGHIHKHAIVKNIINNGSINRLTFGENEPKGCILIRDDGNQASLQFIENKEACQFKVYDLSHISLEEIGSLDEIKKELSIIPSHVECHVKIIHGIVNVGIQIVSHLREQFPHIRFVRERGILNEPIVIEEEPDEEEEVITPESLPKIISETVKSEEKSLSEERVSDLLNMVER